MILKRCKKIKPKQKILAEFKKYYTGNQECFFYHRQRVKMLYHMFHILFLINQQSGIWLHSWRGTVSTIWYWLLWQRDRIGVWSATFWCRQRPLPNLRVKVWRSTGSLPTVVDILHFWQVYLWLVTWVCMGVSGCVETSK